MDEFSPNEILCTKTVWFGKSVGHYPPMMAESSILLTRSLSGVKRRLCLEQVRQAKMVARNMLDRHEGDRLDPESWVKVAKSMGCIVMSHNTKGLPMGLYAPTMFGDPSSEFGAIAFARNVRPARQARILVHETAHHGIQLMTTQSMFGEPIQRFDGDAGDYRHQIAREVERLIFGRKTKG
jgi:hypothetical protein